MQVQLGNRDYPFSPWRATHGNVFSSPFAFDCETERIDEERSWLTPAYVIGAAFDGRQGYYVQRKDLVDFWHYHQDTAVVFHHAAFDLEVIRIATEGLDIYQTVEQDLVWDTQLLHRLFVLATEGNVAGGEGQSTLERCAKDYLGITLLKDVKDSKARLIRLNYGQWLNRQPQEIEKVYLEYLAKDVVVTKLLFDVLRSRFEEVYRKSSGDFGYVSPTWLNEQTRKWGPQTHHIQLKASIVLREISKNGLHIDQDKANALKSLLQARLETQRQQLRQHGYLPGEKGSNKTLQDKFRLLSREYPHMRFPKTEKTDQFTTSFDALQEFVGSIPFIKELLEYRETEKLLNTFMTRMNKKVLRPSFNVLVKTGRTSSFGEINAQNLPKDPQIRSCFVPSPGRVFLDCDYKTIELVTLAQACLSQFGLPSRMAEVINSGKDPHRMLAARVKNIPESNVTHEDRSRAKAINFGKPGGMGNKALQDYAKTTYGILLSDVEVQSLTDAWHGEFPEMRQFLTGNSELGFQAAVVCDLNPQDYGFQTGQHWQNYNVDLQQLQTILGAMLLKTICVKEPKTRNGRKYDEKEMDYFWSRLQAASLKLSSPAQADLAKRTPSRLLLKEVRSQIDLDSVFTLTGRLRAKASYTARHNTIFQGLAADGAKLALWKLWRAGYRIVNFVHDQVLIEISQDCDYEAESKKVRQLMVEGMKAVVPDVRVEVPKPNGSPVKKSWGDNCIGDMSFRLIDTSDGTVLCG